MARINIEDSIYKDNRFIKLTIKLGNIDTALGALVRAWALAQKYYLSPHKMIPKAVWDEQEINNEVIKVGLAEVVEVDFIRLKGADEQFTWLRQRQECGKLGGLKSLRKSQAVGKRSVSGSKPPSLSLIDNNIINNIICDLPPAESPADEVLVDGKGRITPQGLFNLWNSQAHPSLPRAIKLTSKRRMQINARIREYPEAEFWQDAITVLNSSKFCLGQVSVSGSRTKPWMADFDWFIKPDSAIKLIEGKYTK